jgi:hypothetical protein
MNEIIINALSSYNFPTNYITSKATTRPYIVFNYIDNRGDDYAEDEPNSIRYVIQIHVFFDIGFDHITVVEQIRETLFASGFSYPSIAASISEENTSLFHVVLECEYIKAREVTNG